jgi:WD40 repeat protein
MVLNGHEGAVSSAAFSPDGSRIVTASYDKTARLWDVANGKELMVLRGHGDGVVCRLQSRWVARCHRVI